MPKRFLRDLGSEEKRVLPSLSSYREDSFSELTPWVKALSMSLADSRALSFLANSWWVHTPVETFPSWPSWLTKKLILRTSKALWFGLQHS